MGRRGSSLKHMYVCIYVNGLQGRYNDEKNVKKGDVNIEEKDRREEGTGKEGEIKHSESRRLRSDNFVAIKRDIKELI